MATKKALTEREEVEAIKRRMKHYSAERQPAHWLVTDWPLLHSVLGDDVRGIPYGKVIELSGTPGTAKSGLALELCAAAKRDGARIGWVDSEVAWDDEWSQAHGLDPEEVARFFPDIVSGVSKRSKKFTKKKVEDEDEDAQTTGLHMLSAEEMLEEAEAWMKKKLLDDRNCKIVVVVDSIPALLPASESERSLEDSQQRGGMSPFITRWLQKWVPLCATHNVLLILINHVRTKPGMAFGDPTYEPGGSALYHYCSIKVRMRRAGGKTGKMIGGGRQIGIKGFITNKKNKVGGIEGVSCGFKFFFRKPMKFTTAEEMKALTQGGEK